MNSPPGSPWWRRNRWGIAAVVPLLAAAMWFSPDDSFRTLRDEHLEEVVAPGDDGWASYRGARLRLTGFGPAELSDEDGQPFRVPGLTAWQSTITIEAGADPEALSGCRIELEDAAGRRYLESPQALGSASGPGGGGLYAADCVAPLDESGDHHLPGPFEVVGYFLLPESIDPVALRISQYVRTSDYVRLDVG
jgi:hypothetical protein